MGNLAMGTQVAEDCAWTSTDAERPLRHALEFRSTSYCVPEAYALLREHDIACVVADTAGRWPTSRSGPATTATSVFTATPSSTPAATARPLDAWAGKCRRWAADGEDVYAYFDNDAKGFAPHDAVRLLERVS